MKKVFLFGLFVLLFNNSAYSQQQEYELGSSLTRFNQSTGFFDLSDPESLNMVVSLWGWVKYPGRYLVPINTTITDLLSYGGGPNDNALLDDLRLYRVFEDSTQIMIKFGMNELLHESTLKRSKLSAPDLEAGDILLVPGEPRIYFQQRYSMWLSLISVLISLSILIINITK